jgi:hypothetical protein
MLKRGYSCYWVKGDVILYGYFCMLEQVPRNTSSCVQSDKAAVGIVWSLSRLACNDSGDFEALR